MDLVEHVKSKLIQQLPAQHVDIIDNTWQHTGHASSNGGAHLDITVVSAVFEGQPIMAQHRMIHQVLKEEMAQYIHAMGLKTFTPEAYSAKQA
jgi:BolA protein